MEKRFERSLRTAVLTVFAIFFGLSCALAGDGRTIDLADMGESVQEEVVEAAAPDEWMRVDRLKVSFDYRTVGVDGDAIRLSVYPVSEEGRVRPSEMAVTKPVAGKTLPLISSSSSRHINAEFVAPNINYSKFVLKWEKATANSGTVEISALTVKPVFRRCHRIIADEVHQAHWLDYFARGIYFDDTARVRVEFAYPEKNPKCGVALRDDQGEIVRKVAAKNGVAIIDLKTRGFWELEAAAKYPDGTKIRTKGRIVVLGKPISDEDFRDSRYGMMVINFPHSFARNLGIRWDQRGFYFEKDKDVQTFEIPDDGSMFVFSVHGCPVVDELRAPENRGKQGFFPPADWDEYRSYIARWFAAHPQIEGKKICHNGELDFQWRGNTEDYVKMCRIFTEEARKAYKNVEISGPECSRIVFPYLRNVGDAGYFDTVDVVNVHHYVDGTKPEDEYLSDLQALDSYMAEKGIKKPVYITESGWGTLEGGYFVPVSELAQARYVTRAMALMSSYDIAAIIWHVEFAFSFDPTGPGGLSLMRNFNDAIYPKPSLAAYATVTRNLSDVEGRMKLRRLGPETFITSGHRRRGEYVHILWRSAGEEEMPVPVKVKRAETYLGQALKVEDRIVASESPVYLFSDSEAVNAKEWKAPPEGMVKRETLPKVKVEGEVTGIPRRSHDTSSAWMVPDGKWSDKKNAPKMRLAWAQDGLFVDVTVMDPKNDTFTIAFDMDKALPWEANEIYMRFKGHRCLEYSFHVDEQGNSETFRRNSWVPDMKPNQRIGAYVRPNNKRIEGGVRYWLWFPWASLGLDVAPSKGYVIGIAAVVGRLDGETAPTQKLADGIVAPIDPMKYSAFEFK